MLIQRSESSTETARRSNDATVTKMTNARKPDAFQKAPILVVNTDDSSKPAKANKRQLQHQESSAADEKQTKSSKGVEAPVPKEAEASSSSSNTHTQSGVATHIIKRPDGEETTRLRNRPDGSQKNNVWVKGNASVSQGEVIEVLRKDSAGEQGFAFIRTASNTEGFVRSEYIHPKTLNSKDFPAHFHKKQKLSDDSIPVLHNSCLKKTCVAPPAIKEVPDSIDCSPAQVASIF